MSSTPGEHDVPGSCEPDDQALAASARESELLELLDQTAELICVSDASGQITYANRTWLRTLGYTLADACRLRPADLVAPEHRGAYLELARRVNRGEAVEGFEAVLVTKSGTRVVCRGRASARMVDGQLIETRAVYRDVTEERRVEGMRSRLAATLEATTDFVGITARGGEMVFLNRAGRRLVGLDEDADLSALRASDLHPESEGARLFEDAVPVALRDGKWEGESRVISATGEEIPVSVVIVAHPSVRKGESPYFLSTVMRDLRERVQAEDALRESESRFRSVLENLRLCAMVLDLNGRVLFANDHLLSLTGWTREDVIGVRWFDRFIAKEATGAGADAFADMIARDAIPAHLESDILLRGGSHRRIAWDNVPLRDTKGQIVGTASVGRDVDAERRTQVLKDQLIATVSHELRSPLSAVHGALRVLGKDVAPGRPQKMLDIAIRNTDRVLRLATNLLDIERVEAGTLRMELTATPVETLLADVLEGMAHAAETAAMVLRIGDERRSTGLIVMVDADRIMQVLMNMVTNAIKFSPAGGTITLDATTDGDAILFSIRDEGRGIPEDKLESIFERFEQVHAADAREKGGAGLGLSIARAIVDRHGGRIWAESVFGKGSVFYMTLPSA